MILEVSMRASRAVSWANQILHIHFKSTNHNHYRDDNLKSISFFVYNGKT